MLDKPDPLRRVAVFTGKRGGFGAMLRIMRLIEADPAMELKVIASDMHLNPTFGATIEEVRAQIPISKMVDLSSYGDAPLDRAQALIVVGPLDRALDIKNRAEKKGALVFHASLEPDRGIISAIGRRKVLAFAGIGNPDKFFATLTEAGVAIAQRIGFDDHHRFTAAQAQDLLALARAANLMLVTTEKDLVRLSGDPQLAELAQHASALPVRLVVQELDQFRQLVLGALTRR